MFVFAICTVSFFIFPNKSSKKTDQKQLINSIDKVSAETAEVIPYFKNLSANQNNKIVAPIDANNSNRITSPSFFFLSVKLFYFHYIFYISVQINIFF